MRSGPILLIVGVLLIVGRNARGRGPDLTGNIAVRIVSDLDEIKSGRDRYVTLRDSSRSMNPFVGPEWVLNWYSTFCGAGRLPWLVEVTRDAELIGVVPLWQQLSGPATRRLTGPGVLRAVGRGRPWIGPFEIPGMLALDGAGRDVGRAAVTALCERAAEWTWTHLALGDAAPWLEPNWVISDEYLVLHRGTVATVTLDLTPDGAPFHPRRNLRESLRRSRNRLDAHAGPDGWSVRRATDPVDVGAAYRRLCELHRQRSARVDKGAIHDDVIADRAVRDYVETAVVEMAAAGLSSVYELVVNDSVIATQLVLHTARSTHMSLSGQLETAWDFSAVTHLQWCALRDAEAARHELVDFSAGPIQSKLRWSTTVRSFHEFALVSPRRGSQLAYWAELPRMGAARMREARNADKRTAR